MKVSGNDPVTKYKHYLHFSLKPKELLKKKAVRIPDVVFYSRAKKGQYLTPVLLKVIIWRREHDDRSFALKAVLAKIKNAREGFEVSLRME